MGRCCTCERIARKSDDEGTLLVPDRSQDSGVGLVKYDTWPKETKEKPGEGGEERSNPSRRVQLVGASPDQELCYCSQRDTVRTQRVAGMARIKVRLITGTRVG